MGQARKCSSHGCLPFACMFSLCVVCESTLTSLCYPASFPCVSVHLCGFGHAALPNCVHKRRRVQPLPPLRYIQLHFDLVLYCCACACACVLSCVCVCFSSLIVPLPPFLCVTSPCTAYIPCVSCTPPPMCICALCGFGHAALPNCVHKRRRPQPLLRYTKTPFHLVRVCVCVCV